MPALLAFALALCNLPDLMFLPRVKTLVSALVVVFLTKPILAANVNVRLATPVGSMTLELYADAKPATVTNFLRYIRDGIFVNSFAHRLPQGFVLQGGGYGLNSSNQIFALPYYPAIVNEAGPFPQFSNVTGTIAMAKIDGDPNSATNSWFINLKNNDGTDGDNLDTANGGFTVFGKVTVGMDVIQRLADFKYYTSGPGTDIIVNYDGGELDTLPLKEYAGSGQPLVSSIIFTNWTILDGPVPVITSPSGVDGTAGQSFNYQITSTNGPIGFDVSGGALPSGLSLNPATGLISGIPAAPGVTELTVNATSNEGTGSALLDIYIAAPAPETPPSPSAPPKVTTKAKVIGRNGRVTLKGSASPGTVKVEVNPGRKVFKKAKGKPSKWTFTKGGLSPGRYKFQVRATNAAGQATIKKVSVLIRD